MTILSQDFFLKQGYVYSRQLSDYTWIGIEPLIITFGLIIGMDEYGWEKRYCFEDFGTCYTEAEKITKYDDVPSRWIAKRPK